MDKVKKIQKAFARVDDLINNHSESTQVFLNVSTEMSKIQYQRPLDESYICRQRDWGKIANKVVGAEL